MAAQYLGFPRQLPDMHLRHQILAHAADIPYDFIEYSDPTTRLSTRTQFSLGRVTFQHLKRLSFYMMVSNGWKYVALTMGNHWPYDDSDLVDLAVFIAAALNPRKVKHPADWLVLRPDPPLQDYPWPMERIASKHHAKINYGGKQPIPFSGNVQQPKIDHEMAHEEYCVPEATSHLLLRRIVPSWVLRLEQGRLCMRIATLRGKQPAFLSALTDIAPPPVRFAQHHNDGAPNHAHRRTPSEHRDEHHDAVAATLESIRNGTVLALGYLNVPRYAIDDIAAANKTVLTITEVKTFLRAAASSGRLTDVADALCIPQCRVVQAYFGGDGWAPAPADEDAFLRALVAALPNTPLIAINLGEREPLGDNARSFWPALLSAIEDSRCALGHLWINESGKGSRPPHIRGTKANKKTACAMTGLQRALYLNRAKEKYKSLAADLHALRVLQGGLKCWRDFSATWAARHGVKRRRRSATTDTGQYGNGGAR